jgi:hypothetical protein
MIIPKLHRANPIITVGSNDESDEQFGYAIDKVAVSET